MSKNITAHQKYIRTTPRKLRMVADAIRHLPLNEAIIQLELSTKRAALPLKKVLLQAKANAINNSQLDPNSLSIKTIDIQEGATFKRWRPVSRGRAHGILKRTSHIKVVINGQEQTKG